MNAFKLPLMATASMVLVIFLLGHFISNLKFNIPVYGSLAFDIFIGATVYVFFLWKFDSELIKKIKFLRKK